MTTVRVAINGFGRIGRLVMRAAYESGRDDVAVVAINTPGAAAVGAHLLRYDSVHGRFANEVAHGDDWIDAGRGRVSYSRHRDPADAPWAALDVDVALECSGRFADLPGATTHLSAGARRVLISAPGKSDGIPTVVYGVNHQTLRPEDCIVSNASCTTNALAPIAKTLHALAGIEAGFVTTIHAYTTDQRLLDNSHKDLRRARAAGLSMIPTSTGAARAVGLVLPELKGKLDGCSVRVPTANVSLLDLKASLLRPTSAAAIDDAMAAAAAGLLRGVLAINALPLVSSDFNHHPASAIFDATQTQVGNAGRLAQLMAWYDNEWGFACRMLDTAVWMARL